MNKKNIYIGVGVLILFMIAVGVFVWLKPVQNNPVGTPNSTPFGTGDGQEIAQTPIVTPQSDIDGSPQTPVSGLQKISDAPVAGATIYTQGSTTLVRYMDKATGNIYEFNSTDNSKVRISNTTLPKIAETFWGKFGTSVFARTLKEGVVQTFFGSVSTSSASSTDGRLVGSYLDTNIASLVLSPNKDRVFYLTNGALSTAGFVADSTGEGAKAIWKFPSTEWIPSWPKDDTVFLNTKASYTSEGYLYALTVKTGNFTPVLGHIVGLTSLVSPDGGYVLYSDMTGNKLSLNILNTKTKNKKALNFKTLPEKCVWINAIRFICGGPSQSTNNVLLPDSWYMGNISFDDSLVAGEIFSTAQDVTDAFTAGSFELTKEAGTTIDATNFETNEDGSLIIFQNKKDFSLWILPTNEVK